MTREPGEKWAREVPQTLELLNESRVGGGVSFKALGINNSRENKYNRSVDLGNNFTGAGRAEARL